MAIIGSPDVVQGYTALGVTTFSVRKRDDVLAALEQTQNGSYAIVFITEDWADQVEKELVQYSSGALPAIIAIPPPTGSTGAGLRRLSQIVEQAVGSDILSTMQR
jgi:V/A-type H+-transporting ATPase subunit F